MTRLCVFFFGAFSLGFSNVFHPPLEIQCFAHTSYNENRLAVKYGAVREDKTQGAVRTLRWGGGVEIQTPSGSHMPNGGMPIAT